MDITTRKYWARFAARISEHRGSNPRQVYRPRGMDAWVLIYTLSGTAIIGPPDEGTEHRAGDALLIPAGVIHEYRHSPDTVWSHMWAYFNPDDDWRHLLNWPILYDRVMTLSLTEEDVRLKLEQAFTEIIALNRQLQPLNYALSQNLLERILLLCDTVNPLNVQRIDKDARLERVKAYLSEHYRCPIEIDALAKIAGLSKSRLSTLFKERTGQTLIEFLEEIRVQSAISHLLSSSQSIQEIAERVGYENPFYFSRVFRKRLGVSPRAFRQQKGA